MNFMSFFATFNFYLETPITFLFLLVGILLTLWCGLPQFFALPRALSFLTKGLKREQNGSIKTISAAHALFAAMGTSIGIGTIVGPSLAIVSGGPGALFWLLLYAFIGSATKLVEVTFALHFRKKNSEGRIIGGPAAYLRMVHPWLAIWYGATTLLLFAGWSGIQATALAEILTTYAIPQWLTGFCLSLLVFFVLWGGAHRIGNVASRLVPIMFTIYVSISLWILLGNFELTLAALKLVCTHIFSPCAPVGGFLGASLFIALRQGVYKGVFITESGMGTASIAHSLSDASHPIDQGILAMLSVAADSFLSLLSGLLILISGVWITGNYSNTLIYTIFKEYLPNWGPLFFVMSICLFITTTALGNAFNGAQNFAIFTNYRGINFYYAFVALIIFLSSISDVPLIWAIMDLVLPFVALPNLIGIVILAIKYPHVLKYR